MTISLCIGTSGWSYPAWKDRFYAGIHRADWLSFYAQHFTALEVNATFYRLQDESTFRRWRNQTPANFRFTIKGNRYLTHNRKLLDPESSIRLEREHAVPLGEKLTAVLWQLPASFEKRMDRLETFMHALRLWGDTRHVMEFRHPSWFDAEVAACLEEHRVAACQSDAADWPMWDAVTTDMVYVRLHGHTRTYASAYSTAVLKSWGKRISTWLNEGREVHVYFDNDAEGAAPYDAMRLLDLTGRQTQPTAPDQASVTSADR